MANYKKYPFDQLEEEGDYFEIPIPRINSARTTWAVWKDTNSITDWSVSIRKDKLRNLATVTRVKAQEGYASPPA